MYILMGLRPLPPAPLVAKWLKVRVAGWLGGLGVGGLGGGRGGGGGRGQMAGWVAGMGG